MDVDGAAHHLRHVHAGEDGVVGGGEDHVLRADPQGDGTALHAAVRQPPALLRGEGNRGPGQGHIVPISLPHQLRVKEVHLGSADESRYKQVGGVDEHLLGGAYLLDVALLHNDDPVPQGHGLGLVVGDVDEGGVDPLAELDDLRAHLVAELGVQVAQGLIHQEYLGIADDGPADGHPLALSAGEGLGLPGQQLRDVQDLRRLPDLLVDDPLGELPQLQAVGDVVIDGHVGIEGVVLEDHGDVPVLGGHVVHQTAADIDLPVSDGLQPRHHPQGGGFSAAGGPHQDDELLVGDLQVEVLDRHHAVVVYLFYFP